MNSFHGWTFQMYPERLRIHSFYSDILAVSTQAEWEISKVERRRKQKLNRELNKLNSTELKEYLDKRRMTHAEMQAIIAKYQLHEDACRKAEEVLQNRKKVAEYGGMGMLNLKQQSFSKADLRVFFEEEAKRLRQAKSELHNVVAKRPLLAQLRYVETLIQMFDSEEAEQ
jgi:hypothetical protein